MTYDAHGEHDRRKPEDDPWRVEMQEKVSKLHTAITDNTRITSEISGKLDEQIAKTKAVAEVWETIEVGVRVIGAIGRGGQWVLEKWKPILIIFVAFNVIMHGGSLREAWTALGKIFKGNE